MFPSFPNFKLLSLNDKELIETFTSKFQPYSDFYFFSLWSYDTEGKVAFSVLNNNLVIKFQEYEGDGFFYSFIGTNYLENTINTLINLSESSGVKPTLKLVPKSNFDETQITDLENKFIIEEDPDNADYILSTKLLSSMEGSAIYQKKKMLNKFLSNYHPRIAFEDIRKDEIKNLLKRLYSTWETNKKTGNVNIIEQKAIEKAINKSDFFNLDLLCIYINDQLVGYTFYEKINPQFAICSFQKADAKYKGIFEFLNHTIAKQLASIGCLYMNIEQDLGLPGLRQAKQAYAPVFFLKKYKISKR